MLCSLLRRNNDAVSVIRTPDAVGQVPELLGVVQHFNTLGVGVVAHGERPGDGASKFPVHTSEKQDEYTT